MADIPATFQNFAPGQTGPNNNRFSGAFPDPYLDYASTAMPRSIYDVLRWCEYVWLNFGTYRMAAQRVVRYFLTKVELIDASDDEKEKYEDFLEKQIKIMDVLATSGDNYMCFHGDTKTVTKNGIFDLRSLSGKTVDVLSENGVYRPAEFKSFGFQKLLEVTFSDGRSVLTTPEHEWVVQTSTGKQTRVPTTKLIGRRIPRTVACRPERNAEFEEGVRHGFTFGDGTLYNGGKQARAQFFGEKDEALLSFFEGLKCKSYVDEKTGSRILHGLPAHYKQLPENSASASYWYGFVCGFLAADGTVDTYGCALLSQKSDVTLNAIVSQLPRIGMSAGPARKQTRSTKFVRESGKVDSYTSDIHFVTLLKHFMRADDFLIEKHKANFVAKLAKDSRGSHVCVKSIRDTGRTEEVFCCVEPQTHTFVLENGILTGNCYGQDFVSLSIPFRRYLRCPKCKSERPLAKMAGEYSWDDYKFKARCRSCNFEGEFVRIDRNTVEADPVKVIHWPAQEMRLLYHPLTGKTVFMWEIPGSFKQMIKTGNVFYLENTSWEVIEAIKENKIFRFNDDVIYHLKDETIAGLKNFGWGIPLIMSNFKLAWYLQVLKRFNEAIALDYLMPFRVITPIAGTGREADPVLHQNLGDFYNKVMGAIKKQRKDPTTYHAFPFAIDMKALGGDGNKLAPIDLMEKGTDEFLNAQGVPSELYRGTLAVQVAPVALRLFERTWVHLVSGLNGELAWLSKKFSELKNWENMDSRLQPTSMAYDIEDRQVRLQLAASQKISQQTALSPFGINVREEVRRMLEEEKFQQEEQQRFQQEQSQKQELQSTMDAGAGGQIPGVPGMMPPGGQPGAPGGQPGGPQQGDPNAPPPPPPSPSQQVAGSGGSPSMDDLTAQADQIAQQLLTMPYELRRSELNKIKKSNETLHSLIIAKMQKTRQQAQTQGGFQLLQQQTGQGG